MVFCEILGNLFVILIRLASRRWKGLWQPQAILFFTVFYLFLPAAAFPLHIFEETPGTYHQSQIFFLFLFLLFFPKDEK